MDKETPSRKIHRFIQLIRLDLCLAVFFLFGISLINPGGARINLSTTRIVIIFFLAAGILALPFIHRWAKVKRFEEKISTFIQSPAGQFTPTLCFILFFCILWIIPSQNTFFNLLPLLAASWLAGFQVLLIFPQKQLQEITASRITHKSKLLAFASATGIFIFLVIPARLPGIFDGIPWDTPAEFIFAALLIPLALIIDWQSFSRKLILGVILSLVILRAGFSLIFPDSGLGIRTYQDMQALQANDWHQSYASLVWPGQSAVMKTRYRDLFEFPADWITRQNLASTPRPWLGVSIKGYASLAPDEKLIFLTQGLLEGKIWFTDPASGKTIDALILKSPSEFKDIGTSTPPNPAIFSIDGRLVYKNDQDYQLAPFIVKQDQSTIPAFAQPRLWVNQPPPGFSTSMSRIATWVITLENILVGGLIIACLIFGVLNKIRQGKIRTLDIYAGTSGILLLLLASNFWGQVNLLIPRIRLAEGLQSLAIFVIITNLVMVLCSSVKSKLAFRPARAFLLSCGLIVLVYFILNFQDNLKQFTVFSTLGDPFEYQYFARNIFIHRDFLMLGTAPRAYKFLFPYLVGWLHFLFGQSSSAQFFLNAWCAVLSAMVTIKIIQKQGVDAITAMTSASLIVILLFGTYFYLYFQFGLIEPIAVICLLIFFYFSQRKSTAGLLLSGALTLLLRLDYAGALFAGLVFNHSALYGNLREVWRQLLTWLKSAWFRLVKFAIILLLPVFAVIAVYNILTPDYTLNASDTSQTSIVSIFTGLLKVTIGGSPTDIRTMFLDMPIFTAITTLILAGGTLLGLTTLFLRIKVFQSLDMRWGLVVLGYLLVYFVVQPTNYPPRFSTPMLPIAIIILATLADQLFKARLQTIGEEL